MQYFTSKTILVSALIFSVGCSKTVVMNRASSTPEEAYCSTVSTYSGSTTTASGSASYRKPTLDGSGLNVTTTVSTPIRFAEVQVKSATGSVVQCTETDSSGNFSFIVPQGGTYTVYVNSRGYNSTVQASVLNSPDENLYYSSTASFSASAATISGISVVASATGETFAGAFNIFDDIVKANEFLNTKVSDCSTFITGCIDFSVAPKIQAYWTPGFNPGSLFGSSAGLSFYAQGTRKLYILGGSKTYKDLEDMKISDTDHFDDSVIIHEYGHFIEDMYAKTDSPGGSHDANSVTDPRLAWGEGWADFFSLIVPNNSTYVDTAGNDQGTPQYYFNQDLENNSPAKDVPATSGEGNFREFAITRSLWDAMDSGSESGAGGVENIQAAFREFWFIFTGPFKNGTGSVFRDFGLFMYLHQNYSMAPASATDLSTVFNDNDKRQLATRDNYAKDITSAQKVCSQNIIAVRGNGTTYGSYDSELYNPNSSSDNPYPKMNQFYSNDFYLINHPGGTLTVHLSYGPQSGLLADVRDLDLWVYKEGYYFGDDSASNIAGVGRYDPVAALTNTESVSVTAPAGYYLINVNYYVGGNPSPNPPNTWKTQTYDLTVGSATCP